MFINTQPILLAVDESTRSGGARLLKGMIAQHNWDALRACWIDVYIRLPDIITHDADKNFTCEEFRQHTVSLGIKTKEARVETDNSIGIV